jgi:hypothetical protein
MNNLRSHAYPFAVRLPIRNQQVASSILSGLPFLVCGSSSARSGCICHHCGTTDVRFSECSRLAQPYDKLGSPRGFRFCDHKNVDSIDLQILHSAATLGTFYPKAQHEKERAPRLAEAGHLRAVRRPVQTGLPPPPIGYELTSEGNAALGL